MCVCLCVCERERKREREREREIASQRREREKKERERERSRIVSFCVRMKNYRTFFFQTLNGRSRDEEKEGKKMTSKFFFFLPSCFLPLE